MPSTATLDKNACKRELVYFLRNANIFTITQRGVTTTTATGTFSSATSHIISVTNVKNVRSVVIASVTKTYGVDYTVDIDYDNSGTNACRLAFTSAQSGAYTITYDYGTDKIYPDFPRTDLSLSQFPRIACDIIYTRTDAGGFGSVDVSSIGATIIVYDLYTETIADYITAIRTAIRTAKSSFYFLGSYVQVISEGPMLKSEREVGKDKVFQQNIDIEGRLRYEY